MGKTIRDPILILFSLALFIWGLLSIIGGILYLALILEIMAFVVYQGGKIENR